jgi:hypothetical protein
MQFKNQQMWDEGLISNAGGKISDYGGAIYFFAELWALLMEAELAIADERNLDIDFAKMADRTSHEAMTFMGCYSPSGFMYGAAVHVLAECWEYGEKLRQWHNLNTQIHDEGEQANKEGGVLNPAIMTIENDEQKKT